MQTESRKTKYWIIVASKDHVKKGIAAGIAQACHGKVSPLRRMRNGDYIIYYSGKLTMGKPNKCQQFTAIGQITDDEIYSVRVLEGFCPSRRNIEFLQSEDISILPLINKLDFIRNKKSWGYPFRFGLFEINQHDFEVIAQKMVHKEYV